MSRPSVAAELDKICAGLEQLIASNKRAIMRMNQRIDSLERSVLSLDAHYRDTHGALFRLDGRVKKLERKAALIPRKSLKKKIAKVRFFDPNDDEVYRACERFFDPNDDEVYRACDTCTAEGTGVVENGGCPSPDCEGKWTRQEYVIHGGLDGRGEY